MNDRILELAQAADDYADEKLQMRGEYHPDWHDVRDLKFAELIVVECFKAVMIESKGHMNPIDLMNGMKKRIGITE